MIFHRVNQFSRKVASISYFGLSADRLHYKLAGKFQLLPWREWGLSHKSCMLRTGSYVYPAYHKDEGVALVLTALLIPVLLFICAILFDLSRIYINAIYAEEVSLLVLKIASSSEPLGFTPRNSDMDRFVHAPAGEDESITLKRKNFLENKLEEIDRPQYAEKERLILNLSYGALHFLSPDTYFPIPEPLSNGSSAFSELAGRVNCSLYFTYGTYGGTEAPPSPFPGVADADYLVELQKQRDRIFHVDCAVPLVSSRLFGGLLGQQYLELKRESYARHSGNLCSSTVAGCTS